MQKVSTKIWTTTNDERYDREMTCEGSVIDLDEAAVHLGFVDYIDLRLKCEGVMRVEDLSKEDEVLNFEHIPHE